MKVAFYTSRMDQPATGPGIYRKNLAKSILRNKSPQDEIKFVHYKENKEELYERENDIVVPKIPIISKLFASSNMDSSINRKINFYTEKFLMDNFDFDILHLQSIPYLRPFWLWSRDIKLVTTIHFAVREFLHPKQYCITNRKKKRILFTKLSEHFDAIFTNSKSSKKLHSEYFKIDPEKIYVTYNAAEKCFKPEKSRRVIEKYRIENPYIFHLSNKNYYKNPTGIIRGYEKAVRKYNLDCDLVLAGGGWKKSDIKKNSEIIEEKVRFLGYVPRSDLPQLYSHAEFFLFPSLSESFGMPILEAMSCGTPVLTTNKTAMPEIAGKGAIYIEEPLDYKNIAEKIKKILKKKDVLKEKALKRAQKFSWDKAAKKTLEVYKEVLKE